MDLARIATRSLEQSRKQAHVLTDDGVLRTHAKAALDAALSQPPAQPGFGSMFGQLGHWFQRPENLAQIMGHPALQPLMHPLFRAGGAPLLFGAADLAGHGGQNLHTLTQGPVATG